MQIDNDSKPPTMNGTRYDIMQIKFGKKGDIRTMLKRFMNAKKEEMARDEFLADAAITGVGVETGMKLDAKVNASAQKATSKSGRCNCCRPIPIKNPPKPKKRPNEKLRVVVQEATALEEPILETTTLKTSQQKTVTSKAVSPEATLQKAITRYATTSSNATSNAPTKGGCGCCPPKATAQEEVPLKKATSDEPTPEPVALEAAQPKEAESRPTQSKAAKQKVSTQKTSEANAVKPKEAAPKTATPKAAAPKACLANAAESNSAQQKATKQKAAKTRAAIQ